MHVGWQSCRRAFAGADPEQHAGRERLAHWLLLRRWVADLHVDDLRERARPVGMPVDHPLHPGVDWVRFRVLGDALDLGLGILGLDPARPDDVVVVPHQVLEAAGHDAVTWWPRCETYLEDMGDAGGAALAPRPRGPVRPMGDCDVLTLLGSRIFRAALAGSDPHGMRSVAVPVRHRGWLDLSRIDPAFSAAAAAIAEPHERGFDRPLLLTADEVTQVRDGGNPRPGAARPVARGALAPRRALPLSRRSRHRAGPPPRRRRGRSTAPPGPSSTSMVGRLPC